MSITNWKLHSDFTALFKDSQALPQDHVRWLKFVVKNLDNVSGFRGQHLIGNLLLLTFRFPCSCWSARLLPDKLYAFVDENRHCNLLEFKPIISTKNTLALVLHFYKKREVPDRLPNGFLNLERQTILKDKLTDGQALEKLAEVNDVLFSIKKEILTCAVTEATTGATFQLAPEARVFAAMEILTNFCMVEHIRSDSRDEPS